MSRELLFPFIVALLGVIFCLGGYVTMYRRYTGFIAGFEAKMVTDNAGLTHWLGGTSLGLGVACLLAALIYYLVPQYHRTVAAGLALVLLAGAVISMVGCSRFVRR